MKIKSAIKICCLMLVCLFAAEDASSYEYDSNDFAKEVIFYNAGLKAGIFTFPQSALGRPTVDTDYYGAARPAVPVYPAWKPGEVVTVGIGGTLILKFSHKISDDENNPYGIDFLVFGNAMQAIGGMENWFYGDPADIFLTSGFVNTEAGKVSVSQDGILWYSFESGPFADSFAPTLGRIYDPNNPHFYPGWNNLWWGEATNPTLPLDPNVKSEDYAGRTVAELCFAYGRSAGGTSFDLEKLADFQQLEIDEASGRRWIQYIKIECVTGDVNGFFPEVDAVADVSCCGDYKHPIPDGDINRDCSVDNRDLQLLSGYWLIQLDGPQDPARAADFFRGSDEMINFYDFAILAKNWLLSTWSGY